MKCPHCGAPIHENDQICSFCGSELPVIQTNEEPTSEPTPEPEDVPSEPEPARETIIVTPTEPIEEAKPVDETPLPIDEDDEELNTALNSFMDEDDDEPSESKTKIILITGAIIIAVILLIFGRNLIPQKTETEDPGDQTSTTQPVEPTKPGVEGIDEKALQDFIIGFENEFIKVLNGEDNNIASFLLDGSEAYKYFDAYQANGQKVTLLEFNITSYAKDVANDNKLIVKTYEKVEVEKANEATRQTINNRTIVLMKNNDSWLVESVDNLEPIEGQKPSEPDKPKPTNPVTPVKPPVSDGYKASGSFTGGVAVDNQSLKDIRFGVNEGFERLVIDFTGHDQMGVYTATISDDGMTITITLNGNKNVAVDNLSFASSKLIKGVDTYQSTNENLASIVISLNQPVQMKVFALKSPVRLVVDIMSYGK